MSKLLVLGAISIASVGTSGTAGAYFLTRETIWDNLEEDAIPEGDSTLDSLWTKIKEKLPENLDNPSLKEIKTKSDDFLKNWCFETYKKIYWSWFQSPKKQLLNDATTACIWKIEHQIEGTKKLTFSDSGETNKDLLSKKVETLKNHSDSNGNGKLDLELTKIKDGKNDQNKWKKLEGWCKNAYARGYKGERSNRWLLVTAYCTNN